MHNKFMTPIWIRRETCAVVLNGYDLLTPTLTAKIWRGDEEDLKEIEAAIVSAMGQTDSWVDA